VDTYQRRIAGHYIAHAQNYGFFGLAIGHAFESVDSKMAEARGEVSFRDFS
jgi:hypothetical protein